DDADLPALYSGARCTAFVSLYEGFGLPILESMACGTPVITSNVSSLPEVAGDAALMVSPTDVDGITDKLRTLLDNNIVHADLVELGFEQVQRFSWNRAARQLVDVYDGLLHEA
ncbi:MAG: glycosyltransferase, partial [Chloroflexota bacterium]